VQGGSSGSQLLMLLCAADACGLLPEMVLINTTDVPGRE
jgi:hypothetical protein